MGEQTVKKIRKKIVAGNWKMNKSLSEAVSLASDVKRELGDRREVDVVLCPPFTALKAVGDEIGDTYIKLGAQNMHWESYGAYTGEISAEMLRDIYCHYVILGHSERRAYFHEDDQTVNRKLNTALRANLVPIVCVGESLEQRDGGQAETVVGEQVRNSLQGLGDDLKKVMVAYEPVWAIGTGRTATPEQAQEMHAFIRKTLAGMSSEETASAVRLQYGGSIKPANAAEIFGQPDVDGGLVGGAALEARSFVEIVDKAV
jgi:triosephosphate isomerase